MIIGQFNPLAIFQWGSVLNNENFNEIFNSISLHSPFKSATEHV